MFTPRLTLIEIAMAILKFVANSYSRFGRQCDKRIYVQKRREAPQSWDLSMYGMGSQMRGVEMASGRKPLPNADYLSWIPTRYWRVADHLLRKLPIIHHMRDASVILDL